MLINKEMDLEQEKELVERARNDAEAFGELYDRHYPKIFGYVLRRTASIEISQDVTSEVFLKALKNLGQFRWRGFPLSSWLYRIATNEITNYFRNNKHGQLCLEEDSNSISISNPSAETELLEAEAELKRQQDFLTLHENISKLPVKYQEVIMLRFFENKQIKEIGKILGKREGTVKSLLHRGLGNLRKLME
ncbi:RNA polymerase sigma factor [Candidatus Bipolaricaulota bacterium]|nr:RNA polymerase sigma factor [Candidatus Bipolaricaulota bacterium]